MRAKYNRYFANKEIKYDTLLNDRIAREYNLIGCKIYVVKVTKTVRYLDKGTGKRLRAWEIKQIDKEADLYFSIVSVRSKNKSTVNKIVRITSTIPDYDWYSPQQVEVSYSPTKTWINSGSLSTASDFGFNFKASANYTLTGKNYFNLFFSPGIGYSRYNFTAENKLLIDSIPDAVDFDGYPYVRHINGNNLKQDFRFDYFNIPLDFIFQWYIKSFRIRALTGISVGLRTSAEAKNSAGSVEYYGTYNFGTPEDPWIVNLTDLPDKYGFSTYPVKSINDYSYTSPVNLSGDLGAMIGYSPDKRIDFNLGVYANFGLNKLTKSSLPSHLSEKDGELYPLIYSENKSRLNAAGLYFSVNYNIQEPNIPYSKKIDRELVNRMKAEQHESVFITEKQAVYKEKISISINSYQSVKLRSVKCEFSGLNQKDNFSKTLKLRPKPNYVKINLPENNQLLNNVELTIHKPFSYNITRAEESVKANQISEEFTLTGPQLVAMKTESLKLIVTPIKDYYVFYIDRYQVVEDPRSGEIQANIYSRVREDIKNAIVRNGEGLLYYSLAAPIFYNSLDSTDIYLQKVSQSHYELSGNRLDDFRKALASDNVDLSRRNVYINIYLASYNTYEEFIKQFLLNDLLKMDETKNNWANIHVTIYVPLNLSAQDKDKYPFTGDKLPVIMSNWRIVNIL